MKKILKIVGIIAVIILIWFVIASVSPVSYSDYLADTFSDEKILFESESFSMGEDTANIITNIGNSNGEDYYCITLVNQTDGWLKNQCTSAASYTYYKDALEQTNQPDAHISDFTDTFRNNAEYGCFIGSVPSDCQSLSFNGISANLIAQNITANSKDYHFCLYYLSEKYSEKAEIEYINNNNQNIDIVIENY